VFEANVDASVDASAQCGVNGGLFRLSLIDYFHDVVALAGHDTHLFDAGLSGADTDAELRWEDLTAPQPSQTDRLNPLSARVVGEIFVFPG
jgi:hypothetical protein